MKAIPSCLFPTTVCVVDDRAEFLKTLAMVLSTDAATYRFFTRPMEVVSYLNDTYKPDPFTNRWIARPDESEFEHRMIDVNILDLHKEVYNPQRFSQISTLVIDYDMPGMTGLEVCESIKDPHIQKILLTGAADEYLAVEAFNQGLIHQFIRKQNKGMADLLNKAIKDAQINYFASLSSVVVNAVTSHPDFPTAISDPAFIKLFNEIIKENNIIEYYLCEGVGTFLLLDKAGHSYGLFTYVEEQLERDCDSEEAETCAPEILSHLKSYKSMLCYHKDGGLSIPDGQDWGPYIYPAHSLQGRQTYYYAFGQNMIDVDLNKITSFEKYKKTKSTDLNKCFVNTRELVV